MASITDRFQALRHARAVRLIARSGIFDEAWYLAQRPDCAASGLNPILHYLLVGAAAGAGPHLLFDAAWLARGRRGARRRAANPLLDYLRFGAARGVDPSPYFDSAHYRALAGDLEGLTPLGHFIRFGLERGLTPSPYFDRAFYLSAYPDVKASGLDPFLHFVASGSRETRSPSALFDAPWFVAREPELRESGLEPLAAYLAYGAAAGARPQEGFDPVFYAGAAGVPLGAALRRYAREGRAGWRSAHRLLPPPGSPAASFQDLPWRRAAPACAAAPFRALIVDPAGAPAAQALRATLASWAALDVHVLASGGAARPEGREAALDLGGLARAGLPEAVVLDRAARALKFHDPEAVVVSAGEPGAALARACRETGLALVTLDAEAGAAERCAGLLRWALAYRETPRRSVSVVVPNYNHARFLDERLGSILAQTLAPDEILFLDDASDDDSLAVAKRWRARAKIPFVILAAAQNGGSPFRQWAKGVRAARGDLVWIAESDDAADPRFLETMTGCFARPGLALAYCDSKTLGAAGDLLASSARFYTDTLDAERWLAGRRAEGADETVRALVVKNTIPNVSAVLFSRAALVPALGEIESRRYCGDWAAYVEALRYGALAYRPQALNLRRQDAASVTGQGERSVAAVGEALAVKRSIFARLRVEDEALALSFAQSVFEYERRSLAQEAPRPGFCENPELQDALDALSQPLARLGPALDLHGQRAERFLEALAACDPGLSRAQGRALAAHALDELRALARRA